MHGYLDGEVKIIQILPGRAKSIIFDPTGGREKRAQKGRQDLHPIRLIQQR